jgi:hypothetical protein
LLLVAVVVVEPTVHPVVVVVNPVLIPPIPFCLATELVLSQQSP